MNGTFKKLEIDQINLSLKMCTVKNHKKEYKIEFFKYFQNENKIY